MNNHIADSEIEMLKAFLARTEEGVRRQAERQGIPEMPPLLLRILALDNAVRDVLTVFLNELAPFPPQAPVEVAMRVASYVLSSLPIEMQEAGLSDLLANLPATHSRRVAQGMTILTEWQEGDHVRPGTPNFKN